MKIVVKIKDAEEFCKFFVFFGITEPNFLDFLSLFWFKTGVDRVMAFCMKNPKKSFKIMINGKKYHLVSDETPNAISYEEYVLLMDMNK